MGAFEAEGCCRLLSGVTHTPPHTHLGSLTPPCCIPLTPRPRAGRELDSSHSWLLSLPKLDPSACPSVCQHPLPSTGLLALEFASGWSQQEAVEINGRRERENGIYSSMAGCSSRPGALPSTVLHQILGIPHPFHLPVSSWFPFLPQLARCTALLLVDFLSPHRTFFKLPRVSCHCFLLGPPTPPCNARP